MKYIINYACVLLLILVTTSCEDFTDIEQPGRLGSDQAFQNTQDLVAGNLGVYNRFDYTPMIQFNAVFTDQISIGADNGGQGLSGDFAFILNSASVAPRAIWIKNYQALNAASRVIAAAENITPEEGEGTDYNDALGTAHALRAWAHFELLTYFSPDLKDDNAPGIIVLDFVPEADQQLGRSTTGEVYDAILADLSTAESLLTLQSSPTFVSLDFIKALKARLYAYRGNYAAARPLADELLSKYPLANREEYQATFSDEGTAEIIFKLERSVGDTYDRQTDDTALGGGGGTGTAYAGGWAGANFAFINATIDGSPYFEMGNGLFEELSPEDIRYSVLIHPTANIADRILPIGKYTGSEGQPLMNDLKIFRSSEMLFILAEAAASSNDFSTASSLLGRLRTARFGSDQPSPTLASQQAAYKAILDARRIELAYEGFRWVDIKRLGELAGLSGIIRVPSDCDVNNAACELLFPSVTLQALPIPLVELDANTTIQQTSGY